jgi:hypothetical protein
VESPLSRFALKLGVALVVTLRVLPVSVPVTVAVAAFAEAGATSAIARPSAASTHLFRCKMNLLFLYWAIESNREIHGKIGLSFTGLSE